jgi:hypothetical protein
MLPTVRELRRRPRIAESSFMKKKTRGEEEREKEPELLKPRTPTP